MNRTVIVFDDEEHIRNDLKKYLNRFGFHCLLAGDIKASKLSIEYNLIDYAIVDLNFSGKELEGLKIIQNINEKQPNTKIIIFSDYINKLEKEEKKGPLKIRYNYRVSKGLEDGSKENSYKKILNIIKKEEKGKKKNCFVIMPFSKTNKATENQWTQIFKNVIKKSVEESGYLYECKRGKINIGNITEDIFDNLYKADIVIADLTDQNPNVLYELGIRHALRDSTILITQSLKDIPFDLRYLACIEYNCWRLYNDKELFNGQIKNAIKNIEENKENTKSPVGQYLKLEKLN